jgi:hypothetical protein
MSPSGGIGSMRESNELNILAMEFAPAAVRCRAEF